MGDTIDDKIELEDATDARAQAGDSRPRVPLPLPVRLLAVEDMSISAAAGLEPELDRFYVGLLGFLRVADESALIYQAENLRLRVAVVETLPERRDMRPVGIEVDGLAAVERRLIESEMEYVAHKGLTAGQSRLLLTDPAGNWVELSEAPLLR